jgi:hypothetical protein
MRMHTRKLPDERPFLKRGIAMSDVRRFQETQREREHEGRAAPAVGTSS